MRVLRQSRRARQLLQRMQPSRRSAQSAGGDARSPDAMEIFVKLGEKRGVQSRAERIAA